MRAGTADQYLETLNAEQRRAVEHGVAADETIGAPLLVIAGAGSGKTNTLAHRVAHLIIKGADPRRMLLMTFSRRAAAEMTQRVERIARRVLGDKAGIMTDALSWAGPFTASGRGCCANTPKASASTRPSPSTIARIPPTCSTWCATSSAFRGPRAAFPPRAPACRSIPAA